MVGARAVRDHHPGRELVPRCTVVSSSGLMANSRDAGILIIQLRCDSLCRAPERWAARPVFFSGETSRRTRPDGGRGRAANPGRVDMAGDRAEDGPGVGG